MSNKGISNNWWQVVFGLMNSSLTCFFWEGIAATSFVAFVFASCKLDGKNIRL